MPGRLTPQQQVLAALTLITIKLDALQTQLGKFIMSQDAADAAIESEVAILVADAASLKTAFAQLQAEVATGGAPSEQTLTDLANAVSAITGTIPEPPASPAGP